MSIPVQTPFNLYIANGSTTVFPYRFLLNQASDLQVTINGNPVTTGFQVSGAGNPSGGNVTFSVSPVAGTKIAITRNLPLRRDTEYQDNGDLLASTINADFDRIWMALQGENAVSGLALSRPGQDVEYYDARGILISNIKDPVNPGDAVNKRTLDTAVTHMEQQVSDAKNHLDNVQRSVTQNATAAGNSEKQAENYAEQAKQNAAASAKSAFDAKQAASTAAADVVATAVQEAAKQIKAVVADDANRAATAAKNAEDFEAGAQQALKEAQDIAKTPGKSAYEIWVEQQPAGSDTSMSAYMTFQEGKGGAGDVKKTDIPAYLTREKLEYGADLDLLIGDDKEGIYPLDNTIPENTPTSISGNPLSGSLQVRNLGDIFLQELTTSGHGIWIRFCQTGSPGDWQLITVTEDSTVTGYQPGDYILGWINGDDNSLIYSDGTIASGYILTSASFQEEPLSGTWKVMGKRCISYPSSGSAHLTLDPILFKRIA
ncbi:hypothetical protein CDJ04_07145 [Salmonella enterica]|uniref:Phage tail protein n=2 Tax=Salmonella enterica TaxID=28901 RepID=A0A760ZT39_SALER|nr:hypothetical protein [Salmonella enterica]EBZ5136773.1 hypothetical protein [Salmonella enterica subsp. enterica serovar Antsalova]ECD6161637.1 hypothetical protein [Salmonella enterica subsp. enterica]ECU7994249.1 hypothetical protein [Salmonella enterica subsp. enterica serovar Toucra]EHI8598967.1 hypothetical protein [Salmonella enterica subsp. enterica serovar 51:z:1,5]MML53449.1 hypothetical protein [Salmonella enterica subsp. enterica serovar Kidderminster]